MHARSLTVALTTVLGLLVFAFPPGATAHVDDPVVTAQHAFIGDPLFGLGTSAGKLFGIAEDERTAMASTTKLMTLDLTLHAVEAGVVSLNDQVTVDGFAAGLEPPNSVMADTNNVTLEPGEVVSLETLIRGMMYPSGNDAAWAIAYHVAQAYGNDTNGDAVIDGNDFVERMNQHAAAIGLVDTHFTSANGWDDPTNANPAPASLNHYTTARELSMIIDHGLNSHPHFTEVIGFQGTYTDTSQGPNGTKTYTWNWGNSYPGWEGAKGGGTQNCNQVPNGYCWSTSARRIGRRVVASFMQGTGSIANGMFDYGFGQIFHPDARGASSSVGATSKQDTACFSSSRCVSAVLPKSGDVKLVSWAPDIDSSSIATLEEKSLPGSALPPKQGNGQGPSGDVAVARLSSGPIVLANRKGASVELSRWSIDGAGALSLVASNVKLGPATAMALQPVYADIFLSAVINPDGALVLKSWRLDGSSVSELDSYRDESRIYSELSVAGPLTTDAFNGHRAVTAAVSSGDLVHDVWAVDSTSGEISLLGELFEGGNRDRPAISPFFVNRTSPGELFPPVYYATAVRSGGVATLRFYRINATGTPVLEEAWSTDAADEVGVAPLGIGGVMYALRKADGSVELNALDARRNADDTISADQVSQHHAPNAGSLELVRLPTMHAEGDYVTAATEPLSAALHLRGYRSGDRPY
jgi:serine-type D-Ala-D-Ala carboxypeptidase (penicillin-binding protein 5/6)